MSVVNCANGFVVEWPCRNPCSSVDGKGWSPRPQLATVRILVDRMFLELGLFRVSDDNRFLLKQWNRIRQVETGAFGTL